MNGFLRACDKRCRETQGMEKINIWATSNIKDELNALKGGNLCQRLITITVFLSGKAPLKNIETCRKNV